MTETHHPNDAHLDTAHVERDIKGSTVRSGIVTLTAQGVRFLIATATIGALGRILTPRDFGLITMVMVITNLLARFRTLGLESSTVQRAAISHAQVNALFWVNIAFGVALTLVTVAIAPLVALFYGEPPLTPITAALSLLFLIAAVSAQHQAVLRRSMRFGRLASIEIAAVAIAGVASVAAALMGAEYWSLVVMHLTIALVICLGSWIASPWRPGKPASAPELRNMLKFGAGVAGSNFLLTLVRQIDKVLLGWHAGANTLGFYSRGYNLLCIPLQQVGNPLSGVAVSALSRMHNDAMRYRLIYRKATLVLLTLCFPPCVFAALFPHQTVLGILGDQWAEAVPIFLALVPAAVALAVEPCVRWVYVSTGQSGREFTWRLATAVVSIAAFVVGLNFGALGLAIAFSATTLAFRVPEFPYAYRNTPLHLRDLARAAWRPALAPLIAGAMLAPSAHAFLPHDLNNLTQLTILAPTFLALTALTWVSLPGGAHQLRDARSLLANM